MGARSTGSIARGVKVKKKSKFSAHEKIDRGRVGAQIRSMPIAHGKAPWTRRGERVVKRNFGREMTGHIRERFVRNPVPRANRSR